MLSNGVSLRLQKVLNGRHLHPWGRKLGISPGTLGRMKLGTVPATDTLSIIMRAENVNLNWFIEGTGMPFLVSKYLHHNDFLSVMEYHFEDDPNYHMHLQGVKNLNLIVCIRYKQI